MSHHNQSLSNGLSRRTILLGGAATAGLASFSPFLTFRANAAPNVGELQLVPSKPNPNGSIDKLFLLKGDPLAAPIKRIVAEDGSAVPSPVLKAGERRVLRVLHFNDMHNHITDMHKKKGDTRRLAQMVKLVKEARSNAAKDEAVLFVSAGDDHTGSIFDELMGWSPEEFAADAGYRAYSAAGLDVAAIGNHEFDRGAELLKKGIDTDANFPLLSANVHSSKHMIRDKDYMSAAIAEIKGLRIGLIGLTTNIDTRVGQPEDPTLAVERPLKAIENLLPAVSDISDVVVILSHCGYGEGKHASGKAATERDIGDGDFAVASLASKLSKKPVVVVGGHTHTKLNAQGMDENNLIDGVLITQAQAHGKYLGDIALSIAADQGRENWYNSVTLHPIKKSDKRVKADDPKYASLQQVGDWDSGFEESVVVPLIKALDSKLAEVIGDVATDSLGREAMINSRYVGENALANFMNDAVVARSATFPSGKVDFALFNATGVSSGVAKGALSFKAWYDVMPYADAIHVATMSGRQIHDMLQSNVKRLLRPEEVAKTDMSGFVSRGFLHFSSGIRYEIELGNDAASSKAINITLSGQPIESVLDKTFTIAINTYMALGGYGEAWNSKPIGGGVKGDIVSFDLRKLNYDHTGLVYRNEVIAYIRANKEISEFNGGKLDGRLTIR
ncbi:bifunctional metallophosphatase/5'-nucleotidase [Cohaesibacter gelatinilyticus]|uniref:5'-nucleotidase / UDP-sugar diphosphatase n=1 Tax=Cohaesibacter gelatinilyticus TaxID=372072 RepID=A0A285N9Y6_9HYPH|nr:5'-nucleotidase C-terminal domain-containing protein [Cohaesibacter gelatinilyticus]SNZ06314.1 5'-nucleotidase / UDP-sugar diphosphatase [Cohaesibacter gelatinilyticus]